MSTRSRIDRISKLLRKEDEELVYIVKIPKELRDFPDDKEVLFFKNGKRHTISMEEFEEMDRGDCIIITV